MQLSRTTVLAAGLLATAITATPTPADAKSVTACSRFGHGCITAPTRQGRFGLEVRLKGGTWISCKQDCPSTLRDETVDFWAKREWERGGGEGRRRD